MTQKQEPTPIRRDTDALTIKEEHVASPDLIVKAEPELVGIPGRVNHMFRSVIEDGREVLELLSSDEEMEVDLPEDDKGMSSDTVVENPLSLEVDSDDEDNKDPHTFLADENMTDSLSSDFESDEDSV